MLIKENLSNYLDYYIQHKEEFVAKYNNKFIALKEHKVLCEADSREDAISRTLGLGYELGTFLVQHVTLNDSETIQRYCSRVYC